MRKWCPNCRRLVDDPGTYEVTKYAKFWRDNKCYNCNTIFVVPKERKAAATKPQLEDAHTTNETIFQASSSKEKQLEPSLTPQPRRRKFCSKCNDWIIEPEVMSWKADWAYVST